MALDGEPSRARIATPAAAAGMRVRLNAALLAGAFLIAAFLLAASTDAAEGPEGKIVFSDGDDLSICPWLPGEDPCEKLTSDAGAAQNRFPTFSPDGERVAWERDRNIRAIEASGAGAPIELTATGRDGWPVWSRDGQWIYFERQRDVPNEDVFDVYRVPVDGSSAEAPFAADDELIQRLPAVLENGDVAIFTTALDGSERRVEILTPEGAPVASTGALPEGTVSALVAGSLCATLVDGPGQGVWCLDQATNDWEPYGGATPPGCTLFQPLGSGMCTVSQPNEEEAGIHSCSEESCELLISQPRTEGANVVIDLPLGEPPPEDDPTLGDDPPPDLGGDSPPSPLADYDLFLGGGLDALAPLTDPDDGIVWLPLVRRDGRVEVGRVPSMFFDDVSRRMLVWVTNDPSSRRESVPTDLDFRTHAPLRLTSLSIFDPGERKCSIPERPAVGDLTRGRCHVATMFPDVTRLVWADWEWDSPLDKDHHGIRRAFRWDLHCHTLERDCSNNTLKGRFGLAFPARSRVGLLPGPSKIEPRLRRPRRFRGSVKPPAIEEGKGTEEGDGRDRSVVRAQQRPRRTVKRADRPAQVEIALVKLAKRQRGFRGAPLPAELPPEVTEVAASDQPECSWLANRKRKFKKAPAVVNNVCANPVWLKAKLRKPRKGAKAQRWRLRLKRPLRPGRYVVYSRATTRRGMPEVVFTKRRGNRVDFRVKKRR